MKSPNTEDTVSATNNMARQGSVGQYDNVVAYQWRSPRCGAVVLVRASQIADMFLLPPHP